MVGHQFSVVGRPHNAREIEVRVGPRSMNGARKIPR
jgi:hypothetical protein